MGGPGSGRLSKEAQIVKNLSTTPPVERRVTGEYILPNYSGAGNNVTLTNNYLKLDCSNVPLTNDLTITGNIYPTADATYDLGSIFGFTWNTIACQSYYAFTDSYIATDNARLTFGTGQDDDLYHDGTNFIIDPATAVKITKKLGVSNCTPTYDLSVGGNGYVWLNSTGSGVFMYDTATGFFRDSGEIKWRLNSANRIWFSAAGVLYFDTDGSGLPHGSFYGNDIAWSQAAAQNTWYNIVDSDIADGKLCTVTHDGNGKLTLGKEGRYLINWNITIKSGTANTYIEAGIELNGGGTAESAGQAHADVVTANKYISLSGSCILDVAANTYMELSVRTTDAGNPTLTVDDVNMTITQVGGT